MEPSREFNFASEEGALANKERIANTKERKPW
jgi:hypothetical protein